MKNVPKLYFYLRYAMSIDVAWEKYFNSGTIQPKFELNNVQAYDFLSALKIMKEDKKFIKIINHK